MTKGNGDEKKSSKGKEVGERKEARREEDRRDDEIEGERKGTSRYYKESRMRESRGKQGSRR